MVNVAGRSKGCNTCRRRKKGCDLERPSCFRCLNDGLVCEGYDRATVFVQHVATTTTGPAKLRTMRHSKGPSLKALQKNLNPDAIILHQGLARSAFGIQCSSIWWGEYTAKPYAFRTQQLLPANGAQKAWWIDLADAISRMSTNSTILRKALSALSLSSAGCQSRDEASMREGQKYYGEALSELRKVLLDPKVAAADENLLPTCLLLTDYEFFNGFQAPCGANDAAIWHAHVDGVQKLLQLRGSWKPSSPDSSVVLLACRRMLVATSFGRGIPCTIDPYEWNAAFGHRTTRLPKEHLRDIMMPIPGLLAKVKPMQDLKSQESYETFQQLIFCYQQLRTWKANLDLDSRLHSLGYDPTNLDTLLFLDTEIVEAIMLYWSMCLGLQTIINMKAQKASFHTSTPHIQAVVPEKDATGKNITKLIRFFVRPESGIAAYMSVLLPAGFVFSFGAEEEKEELASLTNSLLGSSQLGHLQKLHILEMRSPDSGTCSAPKVTYDDYPQ